MRFDHSIGGRSNPFDDADGEDCKVPVDFAFAQAITEIAIALPTQPGNALRQDAGKQTGIKAHRAQGLQPVEQLAEFIARLRLGPKVLALVEEGL